MSAGIDIARISADFLPIAGLSDVSAPDSRNSWRGATVSYVYAEGTGWPPRDGRQPSWEAADYTVVLGEGEDETVFHYGQGNSAEQAPALYALFLKALERGLKVDIAYTRSGDDTPIVTEASFSV